MLKLYERKPKRLFTFGCSFTDYRWATWANILAFELDIPFYNFGKSGAGNYFMANQVAQVDARFNFTEDDLVIVCWTNISREDRWHNKKGWMTPGNIYTQNDYDSRFVKNWANHTHFALRDFSMIKLVDELLSRKTQYHHLQMLDLANKINQWENNEVSKDSREIQYLKETFSSVLNKLQPSFYDVLWDGDVQNKWEKDWKTVHKNFSDGHPTIVEHLEYLEKTFDHKFSDNTRLAVNRAFEDFVKFIKPKFDKCKKPQGLYDFDQKWQDEMISRFAIKPSKPMPPEIVH